MELPLYQVDAFTDKIFSGNPAAVVPLKEWLPDEVMQNIAIENNLSETAFFIPDGDGFHLRWFTPTYEIDLCGHATLATAWVILNEISPSMNAVTFKTNVAGELTVTRKGNHYTMNFPQRSGDDLELSDIPEVVLESLGGDTKPIAARKARDLLLIYKDSEEVISMKPNFHKLIQYPHAVCVTSQANESDIDFISRFFCPYDVSIPEDPVTGSAHCTLTPYWAEKLGKTKLKAYQASDRGGYLDLELKDGRVFITGQASLYMKGSIYI